MNRVAINFHRRAPRFTVVGAFVMTLIEAVLTLLLVRFVWRLITWPARRRRALSVVETIGA